MENFNWDRTQKNELMENLHRDLIIKTKASVLGDISMHRQSLGRETNKCHSYGAFICRSASLIRQEVLSVKWITKQEK